MFKMKKRLRCLTQIKLCFKSKSQKKDMDTIFTLRYHHRCYQSLHSLQSFFNSSASCALLSERPRSFASW